MKQLIALLVAGAFACSAAADCGKCEAKDCDGKPKKECKSGKDCKGGDSKSDCKKKTEE